MRRRKSLITPLKPLTWWNIPTRAGPIYHVRSCWGRGPSTTIFKSKNEETAKAFIEGYNYAIREARK